MLLACAEAPQQLSLAPEHQALHVHLLCTGRGPVRRDGLHGLRGPHVRLASEHSPWSESERSEERPEESRLSDRGRSRSPAPGSPCSCSSCCCRLCCLLRSFSLSLRACCSCSSSFCRPQGKSGWGQLLGCWGLTPTPFNSKHGHLETAAPCSRWTPLNLGPKGLLLQPLQSQAILPSCTI